ncbi:MAG: hypothetical protein V4736_02805 [Bdellovibrionota bacterium]
MAKILLSTIVYLGLFLGTPAYSQPVDDPELTDELGSDVGAENFETADPATENLPPQKPEVLQAAPIEQPNVPAPAPVAQPALTSPPIEVVNPEDVEIVDVPEQRTAPTEMTAEEELDEVVATPAAPESRPEPQQEISNDDEIYVEDDEEVAVMSAERLLLPYKERRETHGWEFALHLERILLENLQSEVTGVYQNYDEVYGTDPIYLPTFRIGYKYNFSLGSVILEGAYGYFDLSDDLSGTERTLNVKRQSVGATYVMDNVFSEPWIAPYAGVNLYNMELTDGYFDINGSEVTDTVTTGIGQHYMLGLLIQMNGADPKAARTALFDYGLENSYVDLFLSKYALTANGDDPDTSTEFTWGAGMRFEF